MAERAGLHRAHSGCVGIWRGIRLVKHGSSARGCRKPREAPAGKRREGSQGRAVGESKPPEGRSRAPVARRGTCSPSLWDVSRTCHGRVLEVSRERVQPGPEQQQREERGERDGGGCAARPQHEIEGGEGGKDGAGKRKRERADQRIRVRTVDLAVEAGGDVAGRHGGKAEEEEGGGEEPGKAKSAALSGKDIAIGEKKSGDGACRAPWAR